MAELFHDSFQNFKTYQIPKAQLIIADIPFNLGINAYASNPKWYKDGDNANGKSEFAGKQFFNTDSNFNIAEFMHFANRMLKPEPKSKSDAGCMIVFCEFEQQFMLIEQGKKYGFGHYINLVFRKNWSAQVLKANMKVVGNCEYAVLLYRDKLPKFRNGGEMVFNCIDYVRDNETPKLHPTQKSKHVINKLITTFTDIGDVVIDPCAGSGMTLYCAELLGRKAYGFEIVKKYVQDFNDVLMANLPITFETMENDAKRFRHLKREE
ncbi:MAG: site-specific DNA-methyltransferase [Oscillospiraceae bacterium]|jgi:site-specific DNA-methyltransferase (adenine-specific)|nr:site-specific DNA-methyltransferase [Oscillospiraceae bacterium]